LLPLDFFDPLFPLFSCLEPPLEDEDDDAEDEVFRRPISSNHVTLLRLYIGQSGIQSYEKGKKEKKTTERISIATYDK
jgi:hypothetical protein